MNIATILTKKERELPAAEQAILLRQHAYALEDAGAPEARVSEILEAAEEIEFNSLRLSSSEVEDSLLLAA